MVQKNILDFWGGLERPDVGCIRQPQLAHLTFSKVWIIVSSGSGAKLTLRLSFFMLILLFCKRFAGDKLPGVLRLRIACGWDKKFALRRRIFTHLGIDFVRKYSLTELGITLGSDPSLLGELIPAILSGQLLKLKVEERPCVKRAARIHFYCPEDRKNTFVLCNRFGRILTAFMEMKFTFHRRFQRWPGVEGSNHCTYALSTHL